MLKRARQVLETALFEMKVFPGAQAAVLDDGRLLTISVGTLTPEPGSAPVDDRTCFDLASITKPVATASAVAVLMQQGKIGLEDRLSDWIEEAEGGFYAGCTVEELLSHTAGFSAWLPLYQAVSENNLGSPKAAGIMRKTLLETPPAAPPRQKEIYSDLDFFLLGRLVEKAAGLPYARAVKKLVLDPLDMNETSFCPNGSPASDSVAPTGVCPWRKKRLVGEVHDDNAWAAGGAAGQAGLFGTATDLMTFAAEIIDGINGEGILFYDDLLDLFCTRPFPTIEGTFTLGWDTVSPVGSLTGTRFGPRSIGHHGFTGTSFWIDPDARVAMALLTNRVYFEEDKTGINRIRPRFFDAVWEDLENR